MRCDVCGRCGDSRRFPGAFGGLPAGNAGHASRDYVRRVVSSVHCAHCSVDDVDRRPEGRDGFFILLYMEAFERYERRLRPCEPA